MAPTKRTRASLGENDESISESNISQASRRNSRKKARSSSGPIIREDSEELESDEERQSRVSSPPDSEEDTAYEQRLTQKLQKQHAEEEENEAVANGILQEVHVQNFMCHKNFTFELGPLINFVCGKNGSGKSALLTALTLCLGGKASATNRGSSLKSFIREGADYGLISVKIKNEGNGAYQPEEYGKSIVVERQFNVSGASGFKIKSAKGRVVSTTKATLEDICDYFALQIDNPMNILSQDLARQFLANSGPSEKYKLFIRGVQLEQLDQDYRVVEESMDGIEALLGTRQGELKIYEERKEKARQRLAMSDRHETLRDRIRHLRRQIAWAQVEEQERSRDAILEEIAAADWKIAALEAEVSDFENAFQAAETGLVQARETDEGAQRALNQVRDEKAEMKAAHDDVKQEYAELSGQQRAIREHLKNAEKNITTAQQDIDEELRRLEELNGGSHSRRIAELEDKKEEAREAKSRYEEHREDFERLEGNLHEAEAELTKTKEPIPRKQEEISRCENQLQNLSRDRGDKYGAFHERMPMLLRAIQQERGFAERPVGPIGNYVQLRKPEWSSQIEKSFGATLSSFIVTSTEDMKLLSRTMNRVNCSCPILIGKNEPIDTTPHEPDARFDTVLRVLNIDSELVRRHLVIQHGIEQTILIADMIKASEVLYDGPRPKNVKRCYCIDPNNRRRGFHLSYTRSGEASQDPIQEFQGRPRMRTDIETQIRLRQEALQDLKRELNSLEEQKRLAQTNVEKCKQAIVRHKRQERDLQVDAQRAEDEVDSLQESLEQDSVDDGRLEALRSHLEEQKEEKRTHEGSFQDAVVAVDAAKEKLKEARNALTAIDDRINDLETEAKKAEAEALKMAKKRATALGEKNAAIARIGDAQRDKQSLEQQQEKLVERVAEYIAQASRISPRVNIGEGETYNSLEKKFEKLGNDLRRFDQEMGASREEIAREATKTLKEYSNAVHTIRNLEGLAQYLKYSLVHRREKWVKFRGFIVSRAKIQFTYFLSERSFKGKLVTNHKEKLLDLQVEPDVTRAGHGRGAKTLSGGEKSFSQICLLLSLWEAMGSPIRCLDEFDVYMDAVNRKLSIDLLLSAARRSRGRQFVLISPGSQAEVKVKEARDVKISEIPEPQRGQARLPFQRVAAT